MADKPDKGIISTSGIGSADIGHGFDSAATHSSKSKEGKHLERKIQFSSPEGPISSTLGSKSKAGTHSQEHKLFVRIGAADIVRDFVSHAADGSKSKAGTRSMESTFFEEITVSTSEIGSPHIGHVVGSFTAHKSKAGTHSVESKIPSKISSRESPISSTLGSKAGRHSQKHKLLSSSSVIGSANISHGFGSPTIFNIDGSNIVSGRDSQEWRREKLGLHLLGKDTKGEVTISTSGIGSADIGHGFFNLTATHSSKSKAGKHLERKIQYLHSEKGTVALQKEIAPKKSSTAEHIHEGGEQRGKKCRLVTGIAFCDPFGLEYVLRYPHLYDLLEKCQPINQGDFLGQSFEELDQLAIKIADAELHNGLAFFLDRYLLFEAIERFKEKYQETRVLVVNWATCAVFQALTPPALTISLTQSEERRRLNLEQHVKIYLEPLQRLTDADHLALFWSIVMPLADEFKPDMMFYIQGHHWTAPSSECLGSIITSLMKLADGKLLVCGKWLDADSVEVSLRTLIHGHARKKDSISEQTLKGHTSPDTLKAIKETTKKYGDRWPCLRRSDVYATMTDKEYPAHEKSKEISGTDSGKGENSTEVVSSSGKVFQKSFKAEAAGRGDMKTTRTLVQEDVKEQRHSEMPSPTLFKQQTEAKLVEMTKTPCESSTAGIFPDFVHMDRVRYPSSPAKRSRSGDDSRPTEKEPVKQKKLKILSEEKCGVINDREEVIRCQDKSGCLASMSSEEIQSTENTAKLSHPKSNEITKVSFSPVNLEEPEEIFDVSVENDSKLPREQPVEQQEQQITGEEDANEDPANLTSTSSEETGSTEETVKLNHHKSFSPITLKQLEEMTDHSFSVEKEIGPSGDVIKLQSYEIIFPANAVDQPTKTKFRLSFLTENLHLPANLIPIAHPIFCSPGKTIFKKDVTLKIPVWFKITDTSPTAEPIYVHLYSKPSGGEWEVIDSVKLVTSESIAFKCKHFCPILPCVELEDAGRGEFTLDYFLCMGDAHNFVSCHCVSSDIQVKMLETRMRESGFKVIHPAVTRQSVKPNLNIPVSLISKEPALYEFESDNDCVLFIDEGFYKHSKSECFTFALVNHGNPDIRKLRFSYKVGSKSSLICCKIDGLEQLRSTGMTEHSENIRRDAPAPLVSHNLHIYNTVSKETHAGVAVQDNGSAILHGSVPGNATPSSHPTPMNVAAESTTVNSSTKTTIANFSVSDNAQCTVHQDNCSNMVHAGEAAQAKQPEANNGTVANNIIMGSAKVDSKQTDCWNIASVGSHINVK